MTALHRWLAVVLGTALVIIAPLGLRALPAPASEATAAGLLRQLRASSDTPYSGYVEALGTLQLPVAASLEDLGPLFGERTRMRVWWRGPANWRVDQILATGETDFIRSGGETLTWEYEDNQVTRFTNSRARLPRAPDLIPPQLAAYLLTGVTDSQASRIPVKRIAGRQAPGLRVRPDNDISSIDHVDLWIDPDTGIPLAVSVYASATDRVILTSSFMDFSPVTPSRDRTDFQLPPGASVDQPRVIDVADAANRFLPLTPPATVIGLPRTANPELRSVGVYGSGLTQFVAIPLWTDAARPLRDQLRMTPTAQQVPEGRLVTVGPLGILLTKFLRSEGGWLIAGTLTPEALQQAAAELSQRSTEPQGDFR